MSGLDVVNWALYSMLFIEHLTKCATRNRKGFKMAFEVNTERLINVFEFQVIAFVAYALANVLFPFEA